MRIWGVPLVLHYRMFLSIAVSCSCFGPYERLVLWALRRLRRAGCLYWNSVQICATLSLLHDLHAIFDPFRGPKLHESAVGILGALLSFYLFSPQYLDVSTVSWHSSASWYGWCDLVWGELPGMSALLSWLWSLPAATHGNQWGNCWQGSGQRARFNWMKTMGNTPWWPARCVLFIAGANASSTKAVRISSMQQFKRRQLSSSVNSDYERRW